MGLLDKIQSQAKSTGAGTTSNNPFVKKNPLATTNAPAKPNPLANKAEAEKVTEETKPTVGNKTNPFAKKTVNDTAPAETVKKPEENKDTKPNPLAALKVRKEEELNVSDQDDKEKQMDKSMDKVSEKIEGKTETPETEIKEKVEPDPKVENNKKNNGSKRNGGKKTQEKKTEAANNQDQEDTTAEDSISMSDIPTTSVSYSEAVQAIRFPSVDPEWETFRKNIEDEIEAIVISADMNPGELKNVISDLSHIRAEIWNPYTKTKTLYDNLAGVKDGPEGLIDTIKKTNLGKNTNDMERKKAGIEACFTYIPPRNPEAGPINLFEVLYETRERYNFLQEVMNEIKYKSNILITMNGALKLEKDLLPGEI